MPCGVLAEVLPVLVLGAALPWTLGVPLEAGAGELVEDAGALEVFSPLVLGVDRLFSRAVAFELRLRASVEAKPWH